MTGLLIYRRCQPERTEGVEWWCLGNGLRAELRSILTAHCWLNGYFSVYRSWVCNLWLQFGRFLILCRYGLSKWLVEAATKCINFNPAVFPEVKHILWWKRGLFSLISWMTLHWFGFKESHIGLTELMSQTQNKVKHTVTAYRYLVTKNI